MSTTLQLSIDDYEEMISRGAFDHLRGKKTELIRGELREISPQRRPHNKTVNFLNRWSSRQQLPDEVEISIAGPIRLPAFDSEPEPDVAWFTIRDDADRHAEPDEVFLIIEVSHTSQKFDLGAKALLYSQAGIIDYWVVEVPARVVHVFRTPTPSGYEQHQQFSVGEEVRPLRFPTASLNISELFAR